MKHAKKENGVKHYVISSPNRDDILEIDKMPGGSFVLKISGMWHSAHFILSESEASKLVDILLDEVYETEEPKIVGSNWDNI